MNSNVNAVDVSKIHNGEKNEIPFSFCIDKDDMSTADLKMSRDVDVSGRVYKRAEGRNSDENLIELEIKLCGEYVSCCARCAEDVTRTFNINTVFGVVKNADEESTQYVEAPEGILDLDEIARTLFFLEMPTRVLCRDDCKGLCSQCGKNLNFGICSCKPEKKSNKALADLKKLLDNYKE